MMNDARQKIEGAFQNKITDAGAEKMSLFAYLRHAWPEIQGRGLPRQTSGTRVVPAESARYACMPVAGHGLRREAHNKRNLHGPPSFKNTFTQFMFPCAGLRC